MKKRLNIFTIFLLSFLLAGCAPSRNTALQTQATTNEASADNSIIDVESTVDEDDKGSPPSESSEAPAVPQAENVETGVTPAPEKPAEEPAAPDENSAYTSRDDVARYIHLYGHLPSNFITKKEAEKLGWQGGSLEPYAPGMCIGGSRFGNYEGLLPEKKDGSIRNAISTPWVLINGEPNALSFPTTALFTIRRTTMNPLSFYTEKTLTVKKHIEL